MGRLLFSALVIVGVSWGGVIPAGAAPLVVPGRDNSSFDAVPREDAGYWRRQYRRHVPHPMSTYPPAYGYYVPAPAYPPAYADVPPYASGDSPPPDLEYGDYATPNGDYGDYPPENGY